MPSVAFFNNKGGVGKTTLVYHVAAMMQRLGLRVVCADLDPQANLTAMFLPEDAIEKVLDAQGTVTIFGAIEPIVQGLGDIAEAQIFEPEIGGGGIGLVLGDLDLARFETRLAQAWPDAVDRDPAAIRATTSLARVVDRATERFDADITLIDVGPNLGAINRAALIGADFVVVPMAPDLYSLRGLQNLGPTLRTWRAQWADRRARSADLDAGPLPLGRMKPIGYVLLQHAMRLDRPVEAYRRWMVRLPGAYASFVEESDPLEIRLAENIGDFFCLATLKNYRSLMPLAQEARKPMFALKVADGALGAQQTAVAQCYLDFEALTRRILAATGVTVENGVA